MKLSAFFSLIFSTFLFLGVTIFLSGCDSAKNSPENKENGVSESSAEPPGVNDSVPQKNTPKKNKVKEKPSEKSTPKEKSAVEEVTGVGKSLENASSGVRRMVDDLQKEVQDYNDTLEDLQRPPGVKKSKTSENPTSAMSSSSQAPKDENSLEAIFAEAEDDGGLDLFNPPPGIDEDWEEEELLMEPISLGEVLWETPENLVRMDEKMTIWVDKAKKNVVLQGWICQTRSPLEFFMCTGKGFIRTMAYRTEEGMPEKITQFMGAKTHEAVVCVDVRPNLIHASLLAIGAKPGEPVRFQPEFKPATGDEIVVVLRWKDADGNLVERVGQEVIKEASGGGKMEMPWVFAGSFFYKDEDGRERYAADSEGEIIGVSNFPGVILDVPKASSASDTELLFLANEEKLPPRGTPVTVLLRRKGE